MFFRCNRIIEQPVQSWVVDHWSKWTGQPVLLHAKPIILSPEGIAL